MSRKGDRILYVQVAYMLSDAEILKREYAALEVIPDNYEKIVVSLDDINFSDHKDIKHLQA